MALKKKKNLKRKAPVKRTVALNCYFCNEKREPDYKDYKTLRKFMTERAKIVGKDYNGVCSRHQRALSKSIKRARHLGLLPFTPSL